MKMKTRLHGVGLLLVCVMAVLHVPGVAHADFVTSVPSWIGPERGLAQVGGGPTFDLPGPAQAAVNSSNSNIKNLAYEPLPLPGAGPLFHDVILDGPLGFAVDEPGVIDNFATVGDFTIGVTDVYAGSAGNVVFYDVFISSFDVPLYNTTTGLYTGVRMRKRPELLYQSWDRIQVEAIDGGLFRVGGFFDIFTELSLDDGQTWTPASGPLRMELVPEPGAVALLGLGGLLAIRRCR
ncbi:MAG: PEP-CTERM sorting domain-containing protein [Planctomycetaceae bacterium]|nr:PEP-CTERM sorting domain-containing protein [Planctomycetaceae bacterium]